MYRTIFRNLACQYKTKMLVPKPCVLSAYPGRMFSQQQDLPSLPVPPLKQTLDKYLRTVKPLLSEEEYSKTAQIVQSFEGKEGPKLQALLEERAKIKDNWLAEWWLNTAYLQFRMPLVIHSSPGVCFPIQNFNSQNDMINYAARLVSGALDYKKMIDDLSLPVQYMGKDPLCMKQYYSILAACRIPGKRVDSVVHFPPDRPDKPTHIIVMHNNQIFRMNVYGDNFQLLNIEQIEEQLKRIIDESKNPGPPLGILTTQNRNSWGKTYCKLTKDAKNAESFKEIHRAIFSLSLDQPTLKDYQDKESGLALQIIHGGGSTRSSGNRWYDKTLQLVVGRDGLVGANYEHAPAEGPPIISLLDHALDYVNKGGESLPAASGVLAPKKLKFNLSNDILEDIEDAKEKLDIMVDDLDVASRSFRGFGKNFPKDQHLSPDAFIQISMQLAFYRMHNQHTATYESASLRRFKEGRTDTIRSCTHEACEFSRAMDNPSISREEKIGLLKKAVTAHINYTKDSTYGKGIDRHLLGLKLTAIENGMNVPELFMDVGFAASNHFKLSTSQVPAKHQLTMCFGPMYPDGYGFCYNPQSEQIRYVVSAFNSSPETDSNKLANLLNKSFLDIQLLFTGKASKL